jgi:nucleoside diphosphate kinase
MASFPLIEHADKKGYWINELESLGISPEEIEKDYYESESNCITELADHVKNIKQALYQEYKTSYSERMIQLERGEEKNAIVV